MSGITIGDTTKIADIGFYINLDRRPDRNEKILANLMEFSINGVIRHKANEDTGTPQVNLLRSTFEIYKKFLNSSAETLLVLEDDCKFLEPLFKDRVQIFQDIHSTDWDLFWLGCVNRRQPIYYKNNCYQTSSTSYAQSYLIKKELCKTLIEKFDNTYSTHYPDELLCLFMYGEQMAKNPENFYKEDQPLNKFPTVFKSLCYKYSFSTQYNSYSDLTRVETNLENWICGHHPEKYNT